VTTPDDSAACYEWPTICGHEDHLACMLAESMKDPAFVRAWRRTKVKSWFEQQIGRWLPWLCRHRSSVGPVDGPMTCMDCGRPTSD